MCGWLRAEAARLPLEPVPVRLVLGQLRRQDVHCDRALELHVPGAVALPHASGPDGSDDLEGTEPMAGREAQWIAPSKAWRCRILPPTSGYAAFRDGPLSENGQELFSGF